MLGVLGLLTGWALLIPLLLAIFIRIGGPYMTWMAPFLGVATSFPLLCIFTVGGIAMFFWGVRQLARDAEPDR